MYATQSNKKRKCRKKKKKTHKKYKEKSSMCEEECFQLTYERSTRSAFTVEIMALNDLLPFESLVCSTKMCLLPDAHKKMPGL